MFPPPLTSADQLLPHLRSQGYAVLDADTVRALAGVRADALDALARDWDDLPPDHHLKDGGRYRRRRHACFVAEHGALRDVPHRAHWQPRDYNALHGGIERWFEPVLPATVARPAWRALPLWLARVADALRGTQAWWGEAHQFRIDTTDGIGRPTPEGAHRDGVDLVAVFLVGRRAITGGETRVFELDGPRGQRFTLLQPWSALVMDDARVIHESTPLQPRDAGRVGHRDTLVVTLRAGGFPTPAS
ncbi:MAG: 2OG-Fe dioxygenase family protein [Ottowia sp.]|uniref:2OG-Fe dioxygenase family protein n=1 Tax=Ottowia sp. TaxID=1898956 RepID=UPI0039E58FE1